MELASMLSGERFSDHPRSVCPIIATVLRAYNDTVDDRRRQDLFRCAALAVGTAADRDVRRARALLALRFFDAAQGRRRTRLSRLARIFPMVPKGRIWHATRRYAAGSDDDSHARMLRLIERLAVCGGDSYEVGPEVLLSASARRATVAAPGRAPSQRAA